MSSRYCESTDERELNYRQAAKESSCRSIAEILGDVLTDIGRRQERRGKWSIPDLAPCESPIEENMLHQFRKNPGPDAEIANQFWIATSIGNYRMDFAFFNTKTGRKVGLECDGKFFHDIRRDATRDTAIVETRRVDAIYRFDGKDCHFSATDCLQLLQRLEPWIMHPRFDSVYDAERPPRQRKDRHNAEPILGYKEIIRTYFDAFPKNEPCYCQGQCGCEPRLEYSRVKTPTRMRYMALWEGGAAK